MSDPYGQQPNNPYGEQPNDPYGQQPGSNPYGPPQPAQPPAPQPYGAGGGYGAPQSPYPGGDFSEAAKPTDGISVAALVTSLLCCLAPIGVILGFVGLSRTKGGQRKGRGFAIAGIVIGILMSITTAALGAALFIFADSLVTPGNAEVGQCVDVDEEDGTVIMREKDCTEEHDAEIVAVAKVDSSNLDTIRADMGDHCATLVSAEDLAKLNEVPGLEYNALIEDPENVEVGDHLVCYVEPDEELNAPLL